jgi:outer membrane protein assembly factor BamE (lipoprotein component of BamABCDE complex)
MKKPLLPSTLLLGLALPLCLLSGGCISAADHLAAVRDPAERLTLGTVQREIRPGMSSADVIAALGAPNIVSSDDQRREVWVYDKLSSEVVDSSTNAGVSPLLLGAQGAFAGAASGNISYHAGATSRSDRMLTVVVKFDDQHRVRDFAYRASQF